MLEPRSGSSFPFVTELRDDECYNKQMPRKISTTTNMTIWNLTEQEEATEPTVYDLLGRADIKCYKGERKTGTGENTRPGKDLKQNIRVVTSHKRVVPIFDELYPRKSQGSNDPFNDNEKPQGDWLLEEINLYLALDDVDLTFETAMKPFDGTGVQLVCDRRRIYKEAQIIQTHKGQRRVLKNCDRPCALFDHDDDDWDCPLGCKPTGVLHFYFRECLDADIMVHSIFETKAFGDVPHIVKRLRNIKKELGSLTQSPYPCPWTRHKIPFILSRVAVNRKRPATELKPENQWKKLGKKEYIFTGKKGDAEFYDLDLQVDPVWMDWFNKRQMLEEMLLRGLAPSKDVEAGLLAGDVTIDVRAIASSAIELPALPPAISEVVQEEPEPVTTFASTVPKSQRKATDDQITQLEQALIHNNWSEDAIRLLLEDFQLQENPSEMNQEQWMQICAIASNPQSAREYNDAALAPQMPNNITKEDWLQKIEPLFRESGWFPVREGKEDKTAVIAMLQSEYGISRMGELLVTQIPEVLELARDAVVRDRWVK